MYQEQSKIRTNRNERHDSHQERTAQLEREIEETRNEMELRLAELKDRLSLGRLRDKVVHGTGQKISGWKDSVSQTASGAYTRGRQAAAEGYDSSPLLTCGIAFGAGLLLGSLMPASAVERRLVGSKWNEVEEKLDEKASHAIQKGREKMASHSQDQEEAFAGSEPMGTGATPISSQTSTTA